MDPTSESLRVCRLRCPTVPCLLCLCPALLLLEQQILLGALALLCCALQLTQARALILASTGLGSVKDLRWALQLYRRLPLNAFSRLWGRCHQLPLPLFARSPAYRLYSKLCNCNLDEADFNDLREFRNLSEFFRRSLKPEVRPICPAARIVSPADGTVLHFGRVASGHVEQVKGVTYTLQGFLGPDPLGDNGSSECSTSPMERKLQDSEYHDHLKQNPENELYHCVIYLSPGDYHRFHSSVDWTVHKRRHFPGHLLSVAPRIAGMIRGLFCINERAVYMGSWRHGFFSYTAVGATNVGSISVFKDEELRTNRGGAGFQDRIFPEGSFVAGKGELFGEFNLGSTVVLLFEAPKSYRFSLRTGQKILVGQSLGTE
uniref:Phosphatidylserine decarboxylase proenzyme, mitochondrial n=1 Tax=Macrostomum lignano TaxID=282301 RepID=A0A1I8FV65_9PLAT